jgi:UDP:flavonoid glycosyltransferase YjiC (YdhE family)
VQAPPRLAGRVAPPGARALAYLSFGTIFNQDVGLLRKISGILAEAGWRIVVSLGDAERRAGGDWPPDVEVHSFVDQMAVLAEADLVVTHGGMRTVSEALASGVASIIVPNSVDQHLVARRAADLGAAIVIDDPCSSDQWKIALSRFAAGQAGFTAAAGRIARSFADVMPVASAVQALLDRVRQVEQ